eukprot:5158555-Prymnesium_polylepis.2
MLTSHHDRSTVRAGVRRAAAQRHHRVALPCAPEPTNRPRARVRSGKSGSGGRALLLHGVGEGPLAYARTAVARDCSASEALECKSYFEDDAAAACEDESLMQEVALWDTLVEVKRSDQLAKRKAARKGSCPIHETGVRISDRQSASSPTAPLRCASRETCLRSRPFGCVCVLTGYEDAAHEHGTRARRADDASGVPLRGHAPSRRQHGPRVRHAR